MALFQFARRFSLIRAHSLFPAPLFECCQFSNLSKALHAMECLSGLRSSSGITGSLTDLVSLLCSVFSVFNHSTPIPRLNFKDFIASAITVVIRVVLNFIAISTHLNKLTILYGEVNSHLDKRRSRYRPGVAERVGRGIALLFHDRGTIRGWVVSSTPRPHFTPGRDPVHILQEAGWAPGPVWTGGKSRPHRDSIPDRPARSQLLYRLSYQAHNSH